METQEITIRVDPDVAKLYESATPEKREKLDLILSMTLRDAAGPRRSLEEIMSDISRKAKERGLTPEILESILNDPE